MTDSNQLFDWWASLKHQGLLISPTKLAEYFDASTPELAHWKQKRLRDRITPVLDGDTDAVTPLLRTVFEDVLEYPEGQWLRANQVPGEWDETLMNGVNLRPDWLWQSSVGSELPVFIARKSSQLGINTDDWVDKRLGVGRSKRAVSRVLEWMRRSDTDVALITNGRQFRLIYAGLDFDAWAEWDVDLWFEAGEPGPQLTALRKLLHRNTIEAPEPDADSTLIEAVKATREGQAELSDVLGERVRRAVELLVRNVDRKKLVALHENPDVDNQDVYIAACRMVMRMVVILFAEARELLPRDNDVYNEAYSLESLHEQLEKRAGGRTERLRHSETAWPRILALFNLVYEGSAHEALPVPEYGGELFRPGRISSPSQGEDQGGVPSTPATNANGVQTALAALESPENELSDQTVFRILTLLTRSKTKVRMGRRNTWVDAPIDFSDLSTEYIGIIYEGLLDYELKRVADDEVKIFLNVGDEPILPFDRLDNMSNDQLADLFGELADTSTAKIQTDLDQVTASLSKEGEKSDAEEAIEPWQTEAEVAEEAEDLDAEEREAREMRERIFKWAKRAVLAAGIVKPPKNATEPEEWTYEFKEELRQKARELVPTDRIFMPGRWYLVRWGGTRKGSGTFYTRPQLVVPTVRRTLEPLCYDKKGGGNRRGAENAEERREKNLVGAGDSGPATVTDETDHQSPSRPATSEIHTDAGSPQPGAGSPQPDAHADTGEPRSNHSTNAQQTKDASPNSSSASSAPLRLVPKRPETILSQKVCDPAMGSGSFLIGALRYLTDALYESLHYHDCLEADEDGERTIVRLADGRLLTDAEEEPIPVPPDHEDFEPRLRARLKRYVVERCIYGVDIDPLAVELARMALWIETMDPTLPFGFIDHKLKVGNALVGAWMDQVRDYPAVAFERSSWNGGDKKHKNGVHFGKDQIGPALKEVRDELVKAPLRKVIRAGAADSFDFMGVDLNPVDVHETIREVLDGLHDLPVHETRQRERLYREQIEENPDFQRLRRIFDTWCAIWFWPFDEILRTAEAIEAAKDDPAKTTEKGVLRESPTEDLGAQSTLPLPDGWMDLDGRQRRIIDQMRQRLKFFHWELEFPDVFNPERQGFDATVGNPPWEIEKPNSKEFFSNVDPLYRSYGKQEALEHQSSYFEDDRALEREWLEYKADYKALSNWCKNRAHPFGDEKFRDHDGVRFNLMDHGYEWRDSDELHKMWLRQRDDRTGFADPEHPFRHQGSADTNSYKLFLESARALQDDGGRLGFIVPSGLYTDYGTQDLRDLFINESSWEWLFSFENRRGIFKDVDGRFKFCPVIVQKGGQTDTIRAAFMHHDMSDWDEAEKHVLDYPRERILQFSPNTQSILELRSERDLEILEKIYDNGVLLGDDSEDGWGIEYATEFHMTNDSDKFAPRPDFEADGYRPDEYGHWLKGDWRPIAEFGFDPDQHRTDPHRGHWLINDRPDGLVLSRDGQSALSLDDREKTALPLYQGIMIRAFEPSAKAWESGTGLRATWNWIPKDEKHWDPQYLLELSDHLDNLSKPRDLRIGYREVARATDRRSMICATVPSFPCGHKVPLLLPKREESTLAAAGILNSFAFDWAARKRLGSAALAWYVLEESPMCRQSEAGFISRAVASQNLFHRRFAKSWRELGTSNASKKPWQAHWAVTNHERLRNRCALDALAFEAFRNDVDDVTRILSDCDHPLDTLTTEFRNALDQTSFFRVDRKKPPELRHTVLAQVAFQDLKWLIGRMGDRDRAIATFAGQRHLLEDTDQPASETALGEQRERVPSAQAQGEEPQAMADASSRTPRRSDCRARRARSAAEVPDHPHLDADEGWMLPDHLTLADYGLGHDDRAEQPQPVASELGPRFYDWQLAQDPSESWEECRRHAELLEQIVPTPDPDGEDEGDDGDGQETLL